jgi:hypothetical protein
VGNGDVLSLVRFDEASRFCLSSLPPGAAFEARVFSGTPANLSLALEWLGSSARLPPAHHGGPPDACGDEGRGAPPLFIQDEALRFQTDERGAVYYQPFAARGVPSECVWLSVLARRGSLPPAGTSGNVGVQLAVRIDRLYLGFLPARALPLLPAAAASVGLALSLAAILVP